VTERGTDRAVPGGSVSLPPLALRVRLSDHRMLTILCVHYNYIQGGAVTGVPLEALVEAWTAPFESEDPAQGGCPALKPSPGPAPPPPAPAVDCNGKYTTKATCDADAACAWCTSAAVPAACNTLADARSLPPSVFTCDKI
jgi:hypothetical protein